MGIRFLVVAVILFPVLAGAQQATQSVITKDPQALPLAQAALAAMGGSQALLSYRDCQATGTLTVYGPDRAQTAMPVVFKFKGTKEVRVELQKPNGKTVRILNQGQAAIQRPDGTWRRLLRNNTLAERASFVPLYSLLAEYQDPQVDLRYVGPAQVNGQPTVEIALSVVPSNNPAEAAIYRSMTQTLFFIDQSSAAISKLQYTSHAEADPSADTKVEIFFSDYRRMNGIAVPFRQRTYSDGALESDLVLSSIAFNIGLSDSEFALPQ